MERVGSGLCGRDGMVEYLYLVLIDRYEILDG